MTNRRFREYEEAIGVAALVAITLSALPHAWQLSAGLVVALGTVVVGMGALLWHRHS
jgi:hypothetical protein